MYKNYDFILVFLIFTSLLSLDVNAENTQSILPENVRAVYPEPDKRVEYSPNAYPLGVQQISVVYTEDIFVNPDCIGNAHIYRDGDPQPFQSVGISGVSVDYEKNNMGSVLFPYSCTYNGKYRVTIPEGFWIVGESNPKLSGALDLNYEIYVPQSVIPSQNVSTELTEFRLVFPEFDAAVIKNPKKIEIFKLSSDKRYPLTLSVGQKNDGSPDNYVSIRLTEPITTQGDYHLFIQANAAEGIKYGPNYHLDPTDFYSEPNTEVLCPYTVSHIPAPAIEPESGIIESFKSFKLAVPKGAEYWFLNDKAVSFIYPVNDDGTLAPDPICRLIGNRDEDSSCITLKIIENGDSIETLTPKSGKYALKLGNGLFSGSWNGEFINSAAYIYYYEIVNADNSGITAIHTPELEMTNNTVYDLTGRKILETSDSGRLKIIPRGIYIINGQKTYITGKD